MATRLAKFGDIPALRSLAREMHERSRYAAVATMDDAALRSVLMGAINANGRRAGCWVSVDAVGVVDGFLIGLTDRVFGIARELYATDVLFYVTPTANARHAAELLADFDEWAGAHPGVIETRLGVHDAIGDDWERVGKLYERRGFSRNGSMYVKRRGGQ